MWTALEAKSKPAYSSDLGLVFRAFAGLFVVINHTYGVIPYALNDSVLQFGPVNFSFLLNGSAQAGVYMFFCLSGYLMGKGFYAKRYGTDGNGAVSFYWSRFLRIAPLYVFYIGVVLTIGAVSLPSSSQTYDSIARLLTFRYIGGPTDLVTLLGHLWSISTEVQFYLLVPLVMLIVLRRPPSHTTAITAIAWVALTGMLVRILAWSGAHYGLVPWGDTLSAWAVLVFKPLSTNLDLFCAGLLLNFVKCPKVPQVSRLHIIAYFAALVLFYVASAGITHAGVGRMLSATAILLWAIGLPTVTLLFAITMIWFAERLAYAGDIPDWGGWRHAVSAFSFLGTLTYGVYLWHVAFLNRPLPFLQQIEQLSPLMAYAVALITTVGFSIATAAVTYYGIEQRFDRYKRIAWWRPASSAISVDRVPAAVEAAIT